MDDSDLAMQEIQSSTYVVGKRHGYNSVSKPPQGPVMMQLRNLRGVRLLGRKVARSVKQNMKAPQLAKDYQPILYIGTSEALCLSACICVQQHTAVFH